MDLDTLVSKLDAGVIDQVRAIDGPYSARLGPGFTFLDISLARSPRFDGLDWYGRGSATFQSNGRQWYGRQTIWAGDANWGLRAGYGHRTGNDYEAGDESQIPASYQSRDIDLAVGFDLSPNSHVEFNLLRLDQSDVEFPGQFYDMDFLVTDAQELNYVLVDQAYFDVLGVDVWFNRTRFEGSSQRTGKRRQIPILNDPLDFVAFTDVDAVSSGLRVELGWGESDGRFIAGADLRYLEQELNETNSKNVINFDPFTGTETLFRSSAANFPIPRSHSTNPGLFVEWEVTWSDRLATRAGSRADWVSTNASNSNLPDELAGIQGTAFSQNFALGAAFVTTSYQLSEHWMTRGAVGTSMRPPTMTELYAGAPFLAVLQQGFSAPLGDPQLDPERLIQLDWGLTAQFERLRMGANLFHGWIKDYVTFEALQRQFTLFVDDALGVQFVNTERATLAGGEAFVEYDYGPSLTWFGSYRSVEGRDHTRNGRGVIDGGDEEPLPAIAPAESRLGARWHEPGAESRWGVEVSTRIVDNQDRVATSLLERETPGFTTFDVRAFWHVNAKLLLVSGVENITDKHYREHLDLRTGRGVFQPGVNFYFGCELTY